VYSADELRSDIRQAELTVARIRPGVLARDILQLFQRLDAIAEGLQQLKARDIDLRPELTRVETIHRILTDKDRIVVRALAARGGLAQLRGQSTSVKPPESHWWWYLDGRVTEQGKKRLVRLAWGLAGGSVVLAILILLYVRFLRPDEATRLRYEYVFDAESQIQRGNYAVALEAYQRALEAAPDDPEVNLMIGVMHEALERPQDAALQYARAESLYGSRALFLTVRAQQYSILGWYEQSETDAQAAIESDDALALAHCILGGAYEGQTKTAEAISAFQTCADLAREQGQDELYVIASTRLAYLLQTP
jgi:hypothetical protein